MPSNYFTMWGMLAIMVLGAVAGALIDGTMLGSLRAAYPADQTKREALDRCGAMDADFSRFSQPDRDTCYRAMLHAAGRTLSVPAND
jgi:hypothetical protein